MNFSRLLPSADSFDDKSQMSMQTDKTYGLPQQLVGDQIRLKQVLINILKLSLKRV